MHNTALNTKLIAMAAKLIDDIEFEELATILSVHEVAEHLNEATRYKALLDNIDVSHTNRLDLENKIRKIIYLDLDKIKRYMHAPFELIDKIQEVDALIVMLYARNNLTDALTSVTWIDDLLRADSEVFTRKLKEKGYGFILDNLDDLLYTEVLLKGFIVDISNKAGPELSNLIKKEMTLLLLTFIYRTKKFFPDVDLNSFNPLIERLDVKRYLNWIESGNSAELYDILGFDISKDVPIERFILGNLKSIYLKQLRYSDDTRVKLYCYMQLVSLEIKNIIDVIEGVRYEVGPKRIIELLIKEENYGN